jgi:hypothetical protein
MTTPCHCASDLATLSSTHPLQVLGQSEILSWTDQCQIIHPVLDWSIPYHTSCPGLIDTLSYILSWTDQYQIIHPVLDWSIPYYTSSPGLINAKSYILSWTDRCPVILSYILSWIDQCPIICTIHPVLDRSMPYHTVHPVLDWSTSNHLAVLMDWSMWKHA